MRNWTGSRLPLLACCPLAQRKIETASSPIHGGEGVSPSTCPERLESLGMIENPGKEGGAGEWKDYKRRERRKSRMRTQQDKEINLGGGEKSEGEKPQQEEVCFTKEVRQD